MFADSARQITEMLPDDAVVLDIGGWAHPFERADYILDYQPYETRGLYDYEGDHVERFSKETWFEHDICSRQPFPFADKQFDFVTCSHTLEDIRDPIWVCSEINRIAKAGYIETPSRLEEQSFGIQGNWVGWGHHHWIVENIDGELVFTFKHHVMHGRASDHFPYEFYASLAPADKVLPYFWEGTLAAREQWLVNAEALDGWLSDYVSAEMAARHFVAPAPVPRSPLVRLKAKLSS